MTVRDCVKKKFARFLEYGRKKNLENEVDNKKKAQQRWRWTYGGFVKETLSNH